jgi:TolA-binding protein
VSHYKAYIERDREGSNIPLAVYHIGKCLWNLGEEEGAMQHYRAAVEEYGRDPAAIGIDMILDEWIGKARQSSPDIAKRAWMDLQLAYRRTLGNEDQHTLRLRLLRVLIYLPNTTTEKQKTYTDDLVREENMAYASPAVLSVMLDKAVEQGVSDPEGTLATRIAEHMISKYTESDYALDARMVLARQAIERGANANGRLAANREYAAALRHLRVISEVFAASAQAGEALLVTGDLHQRREEYDKADEAYKSVLGHREWRNYWPAALYGRAEAAFAQRRFDQASAYYERIYVMYSHYRDWTARAYLKRAKCLRRLNQNDKAREVLNEMLGIEELKGLDATNEAAELLNGAGSRS